jgi:HK97 family phage portal protein
MPLQTGIFSGLIAEERQRVNTEALAVRGSSVAFQELAERNRSRALRVAFEELRTSLENPSTPLSYPAEWLLDIFNGGRTDSGIRVSELTALQVSDVYACVDLISSAIASQPMKVYERLIVGDQYSRHMKRLATEHPLFDLLQISPNDEMSAFVFTKTIMAHVLLWGNGYAEIERNGKGECVGLWPRSPQRTHPVRLSTTARLVYKSSDGMWEPWWRDQAVVPERVIQPEDMIFIPGLSLDGRIGQDVIELARQLVGISLASEKYAAKFFGNGAVPEGVLTVPQKLQTKAREEAKRSWQEAYGGENVHRTALLEGGVTYQKIGTTPSEAQMVEARKYDKGQVATVFHVPLTMLGVMGSNRSSAEQVALEFVNYTLRPWVVAWQQELKRKLFPPAKLGRSAGRQFMAVIDTRSLTLPDAMAKKNFYSAGRQWGFLDANDIREFEDLNPLGDWGESYLSPVNMQVVDNSGKILLPSPVGAPAVGQGQEQNRTQDSKFRIQDSGFRIQEFEKALWPAFRDAFGRCAARKERNAQTVARIFMPILTLISALEHRNGDEIQAQVRSLQELSASAWLPERLDESARGEMRKLIAWRMAGRAQFYLARHGATDEDEAGIESGDTAAPLNVHGKEQAESLAEFVAGHIALPVSLYSGRSERHVETARAIAQRVGCALESDDALDAQGDTETDAAYAERIISRLSEIAAADGGNRLAVTSHNAIRLYAKHLCGDESASKSIPRMGYGALLAVDDDGKGVHLLFDPLG